MSNIPSYHQISLRQGRIGSSWRHIKQTNNYSNSNFLFIDGKYKFFVNSYVSDFFLTSRYFSISNKLTLKRK